MRTEANRRAAGLAIAVLACSLAGAVTGARAPSSDRAIKSCLLVRRSPQPQLVVYGSSRAAKLEPSFLGLQAGTTAFNASVSSATPEDVWAFAHLAHDQSGGASVRALWLLDVESFRPRAFDASLLGTPSLARYFSRAGGTVLPADPAAPSRVSATCSFETNARTRYAPDGYRARDFHDAAFAHGTTTADGVRQSIADYLRLYGRFPRLSAAAKAWTVRTIAAFNTWGGRPVIVLTPAHPAFLRALGPAGWDRRHADLVAFLEGLRTRLGFVFIDASRISVFGGRATDFYDGIHQRVANQRRLVRWIVARAGAALRPAP